MPTFIKTGYWDKLSKAPKGYLNLDDVIKGDILRSVTKAEFDTLVASSSLIPGEFYEISGVDPNLYGGTTIIMQAATSNKLALAGHGIFYNPKYINSQLTPNNGYGIWNNYMYPTFSNIVGTFIGGANVTADNGATAKYITEGLLQFISGDWSLATSIDNGDGATADIQGAISPSYSIGQDVIWGGKHWTNISGNVGTSINLYELSSSDWNVVPFDDVHYNVVADVIHYDYEHDVIVKRADKWNNDVTFDYQYLLLENDMGIHPIKDFQWGNGPEQDQNGDGINEQGVYGNLINNSYLECINFTGRSLKNNILNNFSSIYYNIFSTNTSFSGNKLYNSVIEENKLLYNSILESGSYITDNILNNSSININTLIGSSIDVNDLSDSNIYNNKLNSSQIQQNVSTIYSGIRENTCINSGIGNNYLNNFSNIQYNNLDNGQINGNILNINSRIGGNNNEGVYGVNYITNGTISFNELVQDSNIQENTLDFSQIENNKLNSGSIITNTLVNNSSININILTNFGSIQYNNLINGSNISNNILNYGGRIGGTDLGNTSQLNSSYISQNVLGVGGYFDGNSLTDSHFTGNTLLSYSGIWNNILTNGSAIINHTLNNSEIYVNTLNNSLIGRNTLNNSSSIVLATLTNSNIQDNNLDCASTLFLGDSGTLTSKNLQRLQLNNVNTSGINLSTGTIIYGSYDYSKQLFKNSAGVARLGYYNALDVFTVVNVNA